MRTLKVYSLTNFQIWCSVINYSHHIILNITDFIMAMLYFLTLFTHFPLPPLLSASGNHQSVPCIYELICGLFGFFLDSTYK